MRALLALLVVALVGCGGRPEPKAVEPGPRAEGLAGRVETEEGPVSYRGIIVKALPNNDSPSGASDDTRPRRRSDPSDVSSPICTIGEDCPEREREVLIYLEDDLSSPICTVGVDCPED
jgi:hypothetical protein